MISIQFPHNNFFQSMISIQTVAKASIESLCMLCCTCLLNLCQLNASLVIEENVTKANIEEKKISFNENTVFSRQKIKIIQQTKEKQKNKLFSALLNSWPQIFCFKRQQTIFSTSKLLGRIKDYVKIIYRNFSCVWLLLT